MGSATDCPSKKLGLCNVCDICYAMKAERQYPACKPYRERQAEYWQNCTPLTFVRDFLASIERKRNKPTHLRLNEAGDFYSQNCVSKAEKIAELLRSHGIEVYCYTARKDLNFAYCNALTVNGSSFKVSNEFKAVDSFSDNALKCIGDCKKCSLCTTSKNVTIEVLKH